MRKIGCLILVLSLICCACRKDPQAPINPRVDDNNDTITPTPMPGDVQSLPYYQSFANDFGTYITKDVTGDLSWMIDYNTAKMTGYASSTNNANEDWLISSPVDLTGVNDAKMTMSYIGRYFNNINEDVTIWASMDYIYGDEPYSATWTQVPATLTEGSNWSTFLTAEIALTDYVGQTVTFAVKYLSTDQKAGTLEIQSIAIEEGTATGGDVPLPPEPGGDVQSLPYSQSFASEFGTYMAFDVWGPQAWKIDFSTAKIGGYENGTYYSNEDWLISAPVDLSGVGDAKMTMAYIARYFDNINEDVTIWASTNYNWGDSPATASWTRIYANLTEGTNWNDFLTTEIALTEIVGQTVTLAVKYVSYDGKSLAGTLEIQSITIEEGTATGGDVPTPPTPTGEGSGTAEDPYNVAAGIGLQGQDVVAWVQGYIVGAVKAGNTNVSSNDQINWAAPFDIATNVLIADDPACHEISQCVIVNLPAGKPLRTQVNLMDNPGNLGKTLLVYGRLRSYFGQAGLRDSGGTENDFVLEGGGTPTPTPTPTPGDVQSLPYYQSFANDFGTYITKDVTGDLSWMIDYNTAKMTGYASSTNNANEDWLISSPVDLTGVNDAKMTMSYIGRYFNNINEDVTIWASMDYIYGDEPYSATWTQVPATLTEGSNWSTFLTAEIALTDYVGQTVTFAVKYLSTDQKAGTLEIQSIAIEEKSATPVHEFVDLGLPSGTLWATRNVGASSPEDYGNYYAWGETTTKSTFNLITYKYYNESESFTKYMENDGLTTLQSSDDAATFNWGSGWCMPTKAQWEELMNNTSMTWTAQNGVNGWKFNASNDASLFLPAAGKRWNDVLYSADSEGLYWSSSLFADYLVSAWNFFFVSSDCVMGGCHREGGLPVRPVRSSRQN